MKLNSYSKIYNFGHKLLQEYFKKPVLIEEKIDGSQFSFGKIEGQLQCRSRGQQIDIDAPEKMFTKAVEVCKAIFHKLKEGFVYRGEYLSGPKHNTLRYDRVPTQNIIIFDINIGLEDFLHYEDKQNEATRLGFETVKRLGCTKIETADQLRELLNTTSVLSDNQKVEGVVCKRYDLYGPDKKVLMAKFVSEEFKEKHNKDWKDRNQSQTTILDQITQDYKTTARWDKAIQHLREAGKITDDVKDIGLLMKEVNVDILTECSDEIKERLFKWAWKNLSRNLNHGLPEYYKQLLLDKQFSKEE